MSETIGLWCDECRCKFVRHVCHKGLPCGHSKAAAVSVYAKAFGRGGEHVSLKHGNWEAEFWMYEIADTRRRLLRTGPHDFTLWGNEIQFMPRGDEEPMMVGHWLKLQSEIVIRAFLDRWESRKEPTPERQVWMMGQKEIPPSPLPSPPGEGESSAVSGTGNPLLPKYDSRHGHEGWGLRKWWGYEI